MKSSKTAAGKKPEQRSAAGASSRPRQLVSTACQACREKRVKCDGPPPPCEACLHRQTECIFNVDQDQRRRLARQHKVEDSEFHKRLLYGLLETIRSSNDAYMQDVVTTIRSEASLSDVMAVIDRNLSLARQKGSAGLREAEDLQGLQHEARTLQRLSDEAITRRKVSLPAGAESESSAAPPSSLQTTSRSSSSISAGLGSGRRRSSVTDRDHRKVMAVRELVETPPWFEVPAKPWTAVTDSDRLVSHLISLYFAWWNPHFHALDQDAFIDAMKSRDTTHPLCSPFLVNAMLGLASQLCDFPRVFSELSDVNNRGAIFHNEGQRLWIEENGRVSLTNMQGLVALICSAYVRGRDRAGWMYLSQLVQMHNDMSLSQKLPDSRYPDPKLTRDVQQSFRNAAWANFNMSAHFSLSILKVVSLDAPQWGLPFTDDQLAQMVEWSPYPEPVPPRPYRQYLVYNTFCDLMKRAWRVRDLQRNTGGSVEATLDENDVEDVIADLKNWRTGVPDCLEPSPSASASAFNIILAYYWLLITLIYFMERRESSSPGSENSSSTNSYQTERTRELIFEFLPIHREYHRSYGYSHLSWFVVQTALMGCNTLLRTLDSEEDRSAFSQLCDTLLAGGRKWPLWAGTVLMLRPTAQELDVQLPDEDDAKLRSFENEFWTPDLPQHFSSIFPNYAFAKDVSRHERVDDYEMGELLHRWTELHFAKRE